MEKACGRKYKNVNLFSSFQSFYISVSLYSPIILWSPENISCFREIICSSKAADIGSSAVNSRSLMTYRALPLTVPKTTAFQAVNVILRTCSTILRVAKNGSVVITHFNNNLRNVIILLGENYNRGDLRVKSSWQSDIHT